MSSLSSGQKAAETQAERRPLPETIMTDRNARIYEIAYFMWLDEGWKARRSVIGRWRKP